MYAFEFVLAHLIRFQQRRGAVFVVDTRNTESDLLQVLRTSNDMEGIQRSEQSYRTYPTLQRIENAPLHPIHAHAGVAAVLVRAKVVPHWTTLSTASLRDSRPP